jgi:hypothetical protein
VVRCPCATSTNARFAMSAAIHGDSRVRVVRGASQLRVSSNVVTRKRAAGAAEPARSAKQARQDRCELYKINHVTLEIRQASHPETQTAAPLTWSPQHDCHSVDTGRSISFRQRRLCPSSAASSSASVIRATSPPGPRVELLDACRPSIYRARCESQARASRSALGGWAGLT